MKLLHFFIAILLTSATYLSITSCNRVDYSEEIAKVDTLKIEIDSLRFRFDEIDSSLVLSYTPFMTEDMKWISDSLTKENVTDAKMFMYHVKIAKKLTLTFIYDYVKLDRELAYSKEQLSSLRKDLVNSSIEKEEAMKYLSDEDKAVEAIDTHLSKMEERINLLKDYPEVRKEFYLKMRNK